MREIESEDDLARVRRLVTAHGDARSDTPGVEYVYADAARMPGPYAQPRGGIWLAVSNAGGIGCVALRRLTAPPRSSACSWIPPGAGWE